jgi:hypothetical protein
MISQEINVDNATRKTAYWSAFIILTSFIVYIICFIGILLTSEMFTWTTIHDYIDYVRHTSQTFADVARTFMILMSIAYLILIHVIHEFAQINKKLFSRISISFGIAFMLCVSIHYFVQISAVHFAVNEENFNALEHFVQANPHSVFSSINMLGWTLFLGLSSLFILPSIDRKYKLLRLGFLLNGINSLLGLFAFVFDIIPILAFTAYIGLGAFIIMIAIGAMKRFR